MFDSDDATWVSQPTPPGRHVRRAAADLPRPRRAGRRAGPGWVERIARLRRETSLAGRVHYSRAAGVDHVIPGTIASVHARRFERTTKTMIGQMFERMRARPQERTAAQEPAAVPAS